MEKRYEYELVPVESASVNNEESVSSFGIRSFGIQEAQSQQPQLPQVVSYNEQTGRLELALNDANGNALKGDYEIKATVIGNEPEQVQPEPRMSVMSFGISSSSSDEMSISGRTQTRVTNWVTVSVGDRASEEHYGYQFDDAGRVTRERRDHGRRDTINLKRCTARH